MAAAWRLPLLRLDIGRVFGGLVGSSRAEHAHRAPHGRGDRAVRAVDRRDREGLRRRASGAGDCGTSARVFGTFLTWMQEKTAPVFVIATANEHRAAAARAAAQGPLRRDLLRRPADRRRAPGDLLAAPRVAAQGRAGAGRAAGDRRAARLARRRTEGFSGAEIEQVVIAACFDAFDERRALTGDDLLRAVAKTVPLSVTQAEQIAALRAWADVRAVAASAARGPRGLRDRRARRRARRRHPEAALSRGGRAVEA